jgi:hypothetical protein
VRIRTRFEQHGAVSGSVASSGCTFSDAIDIWRARHAECTVDAGCAVSPGSRVDAWSAFDAGGSIYAWGTIDSRNVLSTWSSWRTVDAGSALDAGCTVIPTDLGKLFALD